MKPRLNNTKGNGHLTSRDGLVVTPHSLLHSRIGGNWSDMFCSTFAAPRGLAAKNYATAVSFINEPVGVCLTLKEVAARLQVCRRTLEREIHAGRFPRPLRIGRSVRVPESDLQAYLARLRGEPPQSYPS
jgi:excisionase family DNA binding protein